MRLILEGDPREVDKILQENRIRVQRGLIRFLAEPDKVEPENVEETVEPDKVDKKEPPQTDTKEVSESTSKKTRTPKSE